MNREILFKAKRIDNGEWVEGDLLHTRCDDIVLISDYKDHAFRCDANTICQYTGLTDKNSRKIWENDVLVEKHKGIVTVKYHAVFDLEEGAWMLETKSGARYGIGAVNQRNYEVIGNIFDNPDLLEVRNEQINRKR